MYPSSSLTMKTITWTNSGLAGASPEQLVLVLGEKELYLMRSSALTEDSYPHTCPKEGAVGLMSNAFAALP